MLPNRVTGRIALPASAPPDGRVRVWQSQMPASPVLTTPALGHHHIGLNAWESARGGQPPPPGATDLYHVAIFYPPPGLERTPTTRMKPNWSKSAAYAMYHQPELIPTGRTTSTIIVNGRDLERVERELVAAGAVIGPLRLNPGSHCIVLTGLPEAPRASSD
jgi:hypothetical protein